jgi:hypothetical protein
MAFMGEFLTSLVKRSMEDPVARREARDKHLATVAAKSAELCAPAAAAVARVRAWLCCAGAERLASGRGGPFSGANPRG